MILDQSRRTAFKSEANLARTAFASGENGTAFYHLERAHILGKPWAGPHSWTHWMMLRVGLRRRDFREIAGQLLRLAFGGLLSILGRLPVGNTGGSNVSATGPMPIPDDLKVYCEVP